MTRLRDEDIEGKSKQIELLTLETESLTQNVESLEDELERMQKIILDKDIVINKLGAKNTRNLRVIEKTRTRSTECKRA